MRTEEEVMGLIKNVGAEDERIRAVWLNGSRVNPNVKSDVFQDYDVVFVVDQLPPFLEATDWINVFGERIITQMPETFGVDVPSEERPFSYLMLFEDGNRIDLTLVPLPLASERFLKDSLTKVLLDKDEQFLTSVQPSEESYYVQPPSAKFYEQTVNEFWWVSTYVAKGLARKELPYAKAMMEGPVRAMLNRMLGWFVGTLHQFQVNVGKEGKYLEWFLPKERWSQVKGTYAGADYAEQWDALFEAYSVMEELMRELETFFQYPSVSYQGVRHYVKDIRERCEE
ncbi:hypothetical protein N781_11540 [Pontibacillus halophilus JSM 076056 = DSM 19796]|uniref:Aminoglycoside 6-adenylyltransferase n=1 Tax=Pontibacillus halophilus JSM 076056 = DSM 19796 TaxID=1385510 RepID=A0A0A5G432_9BACI|nr:aminoglycoside 6-adenylyltransferase [Pontibacillus halophilus]KGX87881.1 hypothetical protein N781_11540 [Pontibacillus halophilus JSM 076056 = DSM 19796]